MPCAPARANRTLDLVVATLYIPFSIYNARWEESWDSSYFYGLSVGLEVLLLAFILRTAWTWPGTVRATAGRDLARVAAAQGAGNRRLGDGDRERLGGLVMSLLRDFHTVFGELLLAGERRMGHAMLAFT